MTPERQPPRAYGGVAAGERQSLRRKQLMAAASALADEGGREMVTVRAVCQRASLNTRYFYENFASVDELLGAVFEQFVGEAMAALTAPIKEKALTVRAGTEQIMRRVVALFADVGPQSGRAIVGALGNGAFLSRRTALVDQAAGLVATGIADLPGRGDRGPVATRITAQVLVGGIIDLLVAWSAGRVDGTQEDVVQQCTDIAIAAANTTGNGLPR